MENINQAASVDDITQATSKPIQETMMLKEQSDGSSSSEESTRNEQISKSRNDDFSKRQMYGDSSAEKRFINVQGGGAPKRSRKEDSKEKSDFSEEKPEMPASLFKSNLGNQERSSAKVTNGTDDSTKSPPHDVVSSSMESLHHEGDKGAHGGSKEDACQSSESSSRFLGEGSSDIESGLESDSEFEYRVRISRVTMKLLETWSEEFLNRKKEDDDE